MKVSTSLLQDLLQAQPHLRTQTYFKSSLTALSHAMEDQVLAGSDQPLVIASFQQERFYRQEAHRYLRIAEHAQQVYVLSGSDTNFDSSTDRYNTITFAPEDALSQEWHLVVVGKQYAVCLLCQEHEPDPAVTNVEQEMQMDQARRFEGIWTFDRQTSCAAARLLLNRILIYRPDLKPQLNESIALLEAPAASGHHSDPGPFTQRLVTYLQAGQYKLLKTYRAIAAQERKERLVNSITTAIRRSLDPAEILTVAVQELGQALHSCRCLVYRCKETDTVVTLGHEFLNKHIASLSNQVWPLQENPLFQEAVQTQEPVYVEDAKTDPRFKSAKELRILVKLAKVRSLLLVPAFYQGRLVGIVELHHCGKDSRQWDQEELSLVEAIATQIGAALIQAEAYANLEDLNQQLEALEQTRSNLIAVTGHELRTPLSTIQVCLESLVSEPDMSSEVRQIMLDTALTDAERLRGLVQDFLTLSRLESGRVKWHLEPLPLQECIDLALSSIRARDPDQMLPKITTELPFQLPLVRADGERLVEVLSKLLDNACKFTGPEGQITVQVQPKDARMVEVTVADTGRGIEPDRLETVFERFYQEEGALRRTTGGTGLGLAICRQIINNLGGKIWAESAGKDQGTQFHFTIPSAQGETLADSSNGSSISLPSRTITVPHKLDRKAQAQ